MMGKMKHINNISKDSFGKYGTIIDFTGRKDDPEFEIIISHKEDPWRIAMLRVKNKEFTFLEKHPSSLETFEPVEGMCLLLLSLKTRKSDYEVFLLDRPVCLNKEVWHGIVTLTDVSKVKITENLEVDTEYYNLDQPMQIFVE
jgi:ureidoglycolate hydrolase